VHLSASVGSPFLVDHSGEHWEFVSSMPGQCFAGFDEKYAFCR